MEIQWCKTMRMVAQVHSACKTDNVLFERLESRAKAGQPKKTLYQGVYNLDAGGNEGGY